MNRCRFCGAAARGHRSATSACRRSRTPTSPPTGSISREAVLPAARLRLLGVPPRAARRSSSRPSRSSATTRTSRRTRRAGWTTPTRYVDAVVARFSPRRSSTRSSRSPATTATCCSTSCRTAFRVLGIEPAANVAEVAQRARHRHAGRVLRHRPRGVRWRRTDVQADLLLGNNVLAHVPDLNDFVGGMAIVLSRRRASSRWSSRTCSS